MPINTKFYFVAVAMLITSTIVLVIYNFKEHLFFFETFIPPPERPTCFDIRTRLNNSLEMAGFVMAKHLIGIDPMPTGTDLVDLLRSQSSLEDIWLTRSHLERVNPECAKKVGHLIPQAIPAFAAPQRVRSCALISNSDLLRKANYGSEIDNEFDLVFRVGFGSMKTAQAKKWKSQVGIRTDVRVIRLNVATLVNNTSILGDTVGTTVGARLKTGGLYKQDCVGDKDANGNAIVLNTNTLSDSWLFGVQRLVCRGRWTDTENPGEFRVKSRKDHTALFMPSTGTTAIALAVSMCDSVTTFCFTSSDYGMSAFFDEDRPYHYYDNNRGFGGSYVVRYGKMANGHCWASERRFIQELVASGVLTEKCPNRSITETRPWCPLPTLNEWERTTGASLPDTIDKLYSGKIN